MSTNNVDYGYEIYIGAPADRVWQGLTDPDFTRQYVYGTRLQGNLTKGGAYAYVGDGDFKVVDGEILEVEPRRRLSMTWRAHWGADVSKDPESRVTYELSSAGANVTRLRVVHDQFDKETATYKGSVDGWPLMLSSLKTLIESGRPLQTK